MLFTIGHSSHPLPFLLGLLRRHGISTVIDVRSSPSSRFAPQFNRRAFGESLAGARIGYDFQGDALGARSRDPACYVGDRADYDRIAATPAFTAAIGSLRPRLAEERLCLLCAERDPLACHRTFLVGVRLRTVAVPLMHILADGGLEPHAETERRLLAVHGLDQESLLWTAEERMGEAYRRQQEHLAYHRPAAG